MKTPAVFCPRQPRVWVVVDTKGTSMAKWDLGPSIKSRDRYKALPRQGKGTSARMPARGETVRKGRYESLTRAELERRADEIGIRGASSMGRAELIDALRNH